MVLTNIQVYGLEESIIASGNPMRTSLVNPGATVLEGDLKRAIALGTTERGSGHDQYLTGIVVQFDVKFSLKAWTEAQRYHWFDFVSSQSTMHCVAKFDFENQCNEYVTTETVMHVMRLLDKYNETKAAYDYLKLLYNLPTGFELTARVTTNYRQLKTMVAQRETHRLPEWRIFCDEVRRLPKFTELTGV